MPNLTNGAVYSAALGDGARDGAVGTVADKLRRYCRLGAKIRGCRNGRRAKATRTTLREIGTGSRNVSVADQAPGQGTSDVGERIRAGSRGPFFKSRKRSGPLRSPKREIPIAQTSPVSGASRPLAYPCGRLRGLPKTSSGVVSSAQIVQRRARFINETYYNAPTPESLIAYNEIKKQERRRRR